MEDIIESLISLTNIMAKKQAKKAKRKVKHKSKIVSSIPDKHSSDSSDFSHSIEFKDIVIRGPHNSIFNIFPPNTFPQKIEIILGFMTIRISEQKDFFHCFTMNNFKDKQAYKLFEKSMNEFWTGNTYGETISSTLTKYIVKIRNLRGKFRRFLHRWRSSRLRTVNSEDIVTMEAPKDPIYIVDWKTRSISVFEASTLMRDITLRLLHNDGFFECPQQPRNPYTNLPLTQAQSISIWIQLSRSKATASSVFTGFRQARWNLLHFSLEYSVSLQLHALRATMATPTHIDYRDRMLDFIHYCYQQEDIHYSTRSFEFALQNVPEDPLLKRWANLCLEFYEAPILYSKIPTKITTIQDNILDKSIFLIQRNKEIVSLSSLSRM